MSSEIKIDKKNIEEFFNSNLKNSDPDIYNSIQKEFSRQQNHIELIASENIVSRAVLEAQGSVLTNKYAKVIVEKDIMAVVNLLISQRT